MASYYKLLPTTDVRKDEEAIIEILAAIRDGKAADDIKLLNYYREVPINFGATVEYIEKGAVELNVHQLQAALMHQQKETLIRSSNLPNDVVAKVARATTENCMAFLTGFSYAQILSDRRNHIRVEVKEDVVVSFKSNDKTFSGSLMDISLGGVAILANETDEFSENLAGSLSLTLHGSKIETRGTMLRVNDEEIGRRFIIQIKPEGKTEEIISHFVFQTQSEIIRELKDKII